MSGYVGKISGYVILDSLIIDPDVANFVSSSNITNPTEILSLSNAVEALKGNNVLGYNFWSDKAYMNFWSPTGLSQSLEAISVVPGQPTTASIIGSSPIHSSDGVLLNTPATASLNLGDTTGNMPREDFCSVLAYSNNSTSNGFSYGKNIDDGDPAPGDWNRTLCIRRNRSSTMGVFFGSIASGLEDRVGVWSFGNDGTNHSVWHDGVKMAATTLTPIGSGQVTGTGDDYLGCRNGNASGVAGPDGYQDDQVTTTLIFRMGTLYTNAHHEVLAAIVNTYNSTV